MKRICLKALLVVMVLMTMLSWEQVNAWEASATGSLNWEYESYGQLGSNGFFGPYDVDLGGGTPDAAVANAWLGVQVGQLASGSDNAVNRLWMTVYPQIRLASNVTV